VLFSQWNCVCVQFKNDVFIGRSAFTWLHSVGFLVLRLPVSSALYCLHRYTNTPRSRTPGLEHSISSSSCGCPDCFGIWSDRDTFDMKTGSVWEYGFILYMAWSLHTQDDPKTPHLLFKNHVPASSPFLKATMHPTTVR